MSHSFIPSWSRLWTKILLRVSVRVPGVESSSNKGWGWGVWRRSKKSSNVSDLLPHQLFSPTIWKEGDEELTMVLRRMKGRVWKKSKSNMSNMKWISITFSSSQKAPHEDWQKRRSKLNIPGYHIFASLSSHRETSKVWKSPLNLLSQKNRAGHEWRHPHPSDANTAPDIDAFAIQYPFFPKKVLKMSDSPSVETQDKDPDFRLATQLRRYLSFGLTVFKG